MKIFPGQFFNGILACALVAVVCIGTQQVRAASDSWNVDAQGAWANDANWLGGAAPGDANDTANADIATFGFPLTVNCTVTVDANRNIGGIKFSNTSAFGYKLSGGDLLLSNGGVIQTLAAAGAHTEEIVTPISIQGNRATFASNATSAGNRLAIWSVTGASATGTTALTLDGSNTGGNFLASTINDGRNGGNLAIIKNGNGMWRIDGGNETTTSFTGGLTLNAGTLGFRANSFGTGTLTINGGRLLVSAFVSSDLTFTNAIVVGGDFIVQKSDPNSSTQTFSGAMDLGGVERTITASRPAGGGPSSFIFSGEISNGGLTKAGPDALTLSGLNTYNGGTTVSAGQLVVNGTLSGTTSVSVAAGAELNVSGLVNTAAALALSGTLSGVGTLGAVNAEAGGDVSPGKNGIGTINTGDLTLGSSEGLVVEMGRSVSGGGTLSNDKVNVLGSVTLDASDLNLMLAGGQFNPIVNDILFLIINDGTDSVRGIFGKLNGVSTTLTEGQSFPFNGLTYQITYRADSGKTTSANFGSAQGNDIALMAIPKPRT